MKFETKYKNIHFIISLEIIIKNDVASLFGDKFQRIPNQTMIELKKGTIAPYNLIIESTYKEEKRTHYWSNVLLSAKDEELQEEIGQYLDDEELLDEIADNWSELDLEIGPAWKK